MGVAIASLISLAIGLGLSAWQDLVQMQNNESQITANSLASVIRSLYSEASQRGSNILSKLDSGISKIDFGTWSRTVKGVLSAEKKRLNRLKDEVSSLTQMSSQIADKAQISADKVAAESGTFSSTSAKKQLENSKKEIDNYGKQQKEIQTKLSEIEKKL